MTFLDPVLAAQDAKYLFAKDLSGETQLVFMNRTENLLNHKKKDGGILTHYVFEFKNRAAGTTHYYWVSKQDAEFTHTTSKGAHSLLTIPSGTVVAAFIKPVGDKEYVNYKIADLDNPAVGQREQVDNELNLNRNAVRQAEKATETVTSSCMTWFISAAIENGKTPREAYDIALQAFAYHKLATEFAILNEGKLLQAAREKLGIKKEEPKSNIMPCSTELPDFEAPVPDSMSDYV